MSTYTDPEFGEVTINKRRGARSIHIKVNTDGRYVATAPFYTPVLYIKQVINNSRDELRKLAERTSIAQPYIDGQAIGKKHTLSVVSTQMIQTPTIKVLRERLLVYLPPETTLSQSDVQQQVRDSVITILRREAKALLPKQLESIAKENGFHYDRVRFSHASGRWGSCSSRGTISLNIALMKLPDELIRYVLIHELCHTREMNHSTQFWTEVGALDPHYKLHKRQIAKHSPAV